MVAGGWGRGDGQLGLGGQGAPVLQDAKSSGEGAAKVARLCTRVRLPKCTLKMAKLVNFMLCVFYCNKKGGCGPGDRPPGEALFGKGGAPPLGGVAVRGASLGKHRHWASNGARETWGPQTQDRFLETLWHLKRGGGISSKART